MPMTMLDKELVAVAASVAAGCRPCTTYHLVEARRAGASDAAIELAVTSAVCVRASATEGMRRHGRGQEPQQNGSECHSTQQVEVLIALGTSLAINCTKNIEKHLGAAKALGVPQDHLDEVFALAKMIRSKAIDHAESSFSGAGAYPRGSTWAEAPTSPHCC